MLKRGTKQEFYEIVEQNIWMVEIWNFCAIMEWKIKSILGIAKHMEI